jgi:hypothetical protein
MIGAELGALALGVLVEVLGSSGTLLLAGGASALAGLVGIVLLLRFAASVEPPVAPGD